MKCKHCNRKIRNENEAIMYTEENLTSNYHKECLDVKVATEKEVMRVRHFTKEINKFVVSIVNRGYINLTIINSFLTIWTGKSPKNSMLDRGHIVIKYDIEYIYRSMKNNVLEIKQLYRNEDMSKVSKDEHTREIMSLYESILKRNYKQTVPIHIQNHAISLRAELNKGCVIKEIAKKDKSSVEYNYFKQKRNVFYERNKERSMKSIKLQEYVDFSIAFNKVFNDKYETDIPLQSEKELSAELYYMDRIHLINHVKFNEKMNRNLILFY